MTYRNDSFIPELLMIFGLIGAIVMPVVTYMSGNIASPMIIYIIAAVLISFANLATFSPAYTIAFIVLKIIGCLSLGWPWIIFTILIDALLEIAVANSRLRIQQ